MEIITEGKFVDYDKIVSLVKNADNYHISNEKTDSNGVRYKNIQIIKDGEKRKQGLGYRVTIDVIKRMQTEDVFLSTKVKQKENIARMQDTDSFLQRKNAEKREEEKMKKELSPEEFDNWKIQRQEKKERAQAKTNTYRGTGIYSPRSSVKTFKEEVEEFIKVEQLIKRKKIMTLKEEIQIESGVLNEGFKSLILTGVNYSILKNLKKYTTLEQIKKAIDNYEGINATMRNKLKYFFEQNWYNGNLWQLWKLKTYEQIESAIDNLENLDKSKNINRAERIKLKMFFHKVIYAN
jgi:hypothetical protein